MQVVVEAIMPVFPPEADLLPQVMQIAAGAVDNLPENPQLNHMENRHFLPPVTAVFQQHAGNAGFLRQANQLETFKQAGGAAHLQADGNPRLQSGPRHRHMGGPVAGDHYAVQAARRQHFPVIGIDGRRACPAAAARSAPARIRSS